MSGDVRVESVRNGHANGDEHLRRHRDRHRGGLERRRRRELGLRRPLLRGRARERSRRRQLRRRPDRRRPREDRQRRLPRLPRRIGRRTLRELLRRRDVRLLLAGQTLSMFGDWAMFFVLAIWAKVLTGSNAAAGLVFFVLALAGLAAPLGGLVVDRLPKRRLMIVTHVAMAAMVCLLLFVNDRSDLWLIYVVAALYGLGGDLFAAARSAMLKAMLPDELLAEANGILQSLREGPAARRAARRRGDLRRVRRRRGRARRCGELRALRRDARAASVRRAGRRRARAVPARGLRGSAAHHADTRAARADDRRVRGDARRRVQRDDHLRGDEPTGCTGRRRSSA